MGWKISVGSPVRGRIARAGAMAVTVCVSGRAPAQVTVFPNAGRTTSGNAGSNPACEAEQVWQNVLSTLVGTD